MLANAALPGRIGELARVGVLTRHQNRRRGVWATLAGTVVAHRIFDLDPDRAARVYVLVTAKIPAWAYSIIVGVVSVGATLFVLAVLSARSAGHARLDGAGAGRRALHLAREGLAVMHRPLAAAGAIFFQLLGWICQLFAVFTAMRAFDIHEGLPAAALVLLVMNVATIIPLWPGNVGAVQVGDRDPARLVRRGLCGRRRVRLRAAGDRGLRRHRRRARLPRAARASRSRACAACRPRPTPQFGEEEAEEAPLNEAERARARVPG